MKALLVVLTIAGAQPWPLDATVVQEAVGLPGLAGDNVFTTGPHLGLTVGTRYRYLSRGLFALHQSATLGGFSHGSPGLDGLFLQTELVPAAEFPFGLSFEGALGVGYFHALSFGGTARGSPVGDPAAMVSLRTGVRFMFPGNRVGVLASYQVMLETPAGITVLLPRTLLHLGLTVRLGLSPAASERPEVSR